MLKLIDIKKEYPTGDTSVTALKGVSVEFRKSEFVSILGQSGCGKTTLLNIIGGLDQYTSGDLIIEGKSTKDFTDTDWDNYRNHSVGFVFQSYNLIPHQTVLSNVELALTLSGVSKEDRKKRAKEALEKVGLGDQFNKKPNQLSGGQMQRVAIARALVNDPEILLADEPTGALDSETSVQVMDILREISADRLVVMVTHNPELAMEYSTRIIKLKDGVIVDDSDPYSEEEESAEVKEEKEKAKADKKSKKKPSMSFFTALSLSLNNLMTKKVRTFLTSFAGSIGIIGIALILSLSNGFQLYVNSIQRETLTSYPVQITGTYMDISSALSGITGSASKSSSELTHDLDKVYSNSMASSMMSSLSSEIWTNDLSSFKKYIEEHQEEFDQYSSSIQYKYEGEMNIYYSDTSDGLNQVYPSPVLDIMESMMSSVDLGGFQIDSSTMETYKQYYNSWQELVDNEELLKEEYDLVSGSWPTAYNEVVLIVDQNNEISPLAIQGLGLTSMQDMMDIFMQAYSGEEVDTTPMEIDYDEVIGRTFSLILEPEYYSYNTETKQWDDMHSDDEYVQNLVNNAEKIKVVGIIRPSEGSVVVSTMGAIGYTADLTEYVVTATNDTEIVKQQKANPDVDVFTGIAFPKDEETETKTNTSEKKEETTTAASKDVSTDTWETPTVSNLDYNASEAKATFTAETFDVSMLSQIDSLPAATEDEIYALIDEKYSGEDATNYKRAVELMLKTTLTISEKKELAGYIDKMLEGADESQTMGMTGSQMVDYLPMLRTDRKLKIVKGFLDGTFEQMAAEAENTSSENSENSESKTEEKKDNSSANSTASTETVEPEPEPEPQPLASGYSEALSLLGVGDISTPTQINIYPVDFESKDKISELIENYNNSQDEKKAIKYTDYIGLLLSSVTKIVNIVSYVLIAFVAISLVVSSIMIGIITYISVLERTKEIGILRAIGASKRDISRVFNAETLIVGFVSGALGIGVTVLLNIPINMIIKHLTTLPNVAQLPVNGAIILVIISMVLTVIAGLIPSGIASRKDPVVALRTE